MDLNFFADTNKPEACITSISLKLADGTDIIVNTHGASITHRCKEYELNLADVCFLDKDSQPYIVDDPEKMMKAQVTGIQAEPEDGVFFGIREMSFSVGRHYACLLPDGKYLCQAGEDRILPYADFIALGQKHYNKGGDVIVECWDEKQFAQYTQEFGAMTESAALGMCELYFSDEKEQKAMQGW